MLPAVEMESLFSPRAIIYMVGKEGKIMASLAGLKVAWGFRIDLGIRV